MDMKVKTPKANFNDIFQNNFTSLHPHRQQPNDKSSQFIQNVLFAVLSFRELITKNHGVNRSHETKDRAEKRFEIHENNVDKEKMFVSGELV